MDNSAKKHISTAGDGSIVGPADEVRAPTVAVLHRKTPSTKCLASPTSGSMEKMGVHCIITLNLKPIKQEAGCGLEKREGLVSLESHQLLRLHLELQLGSR